MVLVWSLHLSPLPFTRVVHADYWPYFNQSGNQGKLFAFDTYDMSVLVALSRPVNGMLRQLEHMLHRTVCN